MASNDRTITFQSPAQLLPNLQTNECGRQYTVEIQLEDTKLLVLRAQTILQVWKENVGKINIKADCESNDGWGRRVKDETGRIRSCYWSWSSDQSIAWEVIVVSRKADGQP